MSEGKQSGHQCCTCPVSRRRFLGSLAALTGAGAAVIGAQRPAAARDLGDEIDIDGLRPRPSVKVMVGVFRIPPPYWLGWPGTSYDLEGHRREYLDEFVKMGNEIGVSCRIVPKPVETDAAVGQFIAQARQEQADAVLVALQHIGVWHWAQQVADSGIPTIVFSPIGTSFTGHVIGISRQPGVHVVSSLRTEGIRQALLMVRCKKQFEASRLLVIAGDTRSESVLANLGTKVRNIPRREFKELFDRMPETAEVRLIAEEMSDAAQKIVEPSKQDMLNAARTLTTAKRLLTDEHANALSMDCLGMVAARDVPTPPCEAWSVMHNHGLTCGCEADLFGAISLMFSSYLLDRPGYMNDPVAETVANTLVAAHCTSGTLIHGFDKDPVPVILRSHSESNIGVSPQVLWPEGEKCTLVRFTDPSTILVDTGTVAGNVDTPPAGGCRTSVEIAMDRVEDARDVLGFHQVVVSGDHRRTLESYAQMHGLKVVHSPERAPEHRGGEA